MFSKFSISLLVALVFARVLGGIVSAQGPAGGRTRGRWLALITKKLGMTVEELPAALVTQERGSGNGRQAAHRDP